jgi:hypothetical protein
MTPLSTLAWIVTTSWLLAAPAVDGDLPPSHVRIVPIDAANAMVIDDTGVRFEDMPVRPNTKYGSRSLSFPLQGPGTYALSAKATGNGYNSCVQVHVFDAKGDILLKVSTRRYGLASYFVPPKEAVAASFLVYSCLLEEVRLVRVGDENAIK